ncbi:hypothetical protein [Microbacterium sp. CFBP9034]|uniref:hypothetical protein n=1 Tax=Microbacterium sp. CFBP9034 TaxID=3096540 RepID=UPI002A6B4551|nr:hypothetical protein [Microbacterium sp. CFBP9034]MDY0907859.1 hypothetical protein [Microbacterium sp. CFBP9034]
MNTVSEARTPLIDRSQTEAVLYRVAICALTWHPRKADADPGYRVEDDQRWCLAPLEGADPGLPIRVLVAATIHDPSRYRAQLVQALSALADE